MGAQRENTRFASSLIPADPRSDNEKKKDSQSLTIYEAANYAQYPRDVICPSKYEPYVLL